MSVSQHAGFTLVVLMVVLAVSRGLLLALMNLIISQARSSAQMEALLRLQSNWKRVEFLLVQGIEEASNASVSGSTLTLLDNRTISHGLTGNAPESTGPPIDANGLLTAETSRTDVLIRGVTAFIPAVQNQNITSRLDLRDPTGVNYVNQSSGSELRIRSVIPAS